MKAVVEPLEGNKVKLSIEVDEQEFEHDIDAAFRRISREVRVPGFRPGKAPRRILEARLGKETGRVEALRDALPVYYSKALLENDVDAIDAPEIDITAGQESGPVSFDAVVEVRPQIKIAGYEGLRVVVPNPAVADEDVDAQVDRLRSNFGELNVVQRPARNGDYLTIDLSGTRGGEPVEGLATDDLLYELGSDSLLPGLDEKLHGAKVGDIQAFDADIGAEPTNVKVLVKEVKEKVLPEVTDEWASEASEFETVEELRADITKRLGLVRRVESVLALRNGAVDALVELVEIDVPTVLVDAEVKRRLEDLARRLDAQGATIAEYLEATGQTAEQLVEQGRQQAVPSVKADLALRAVAEAEQIEPTEEELEAEIDRLAESYGMKPKDLRRNLERAEGMPAVRSDWKKSKALEWLVEHVEVVDADGQPIDRALLDPNFEDEKAESVTPTNETADERTEEAVET